MKFEKVLINSKDDLVGYRVQILELFYVCFGFELDVDLWEWAYLSNPSGEPLVSLYFYEGALVGHYAAIPMVLKLNSQEVLALLSMTTMVHKSFRRHGIFIKQAEDVYAKAIELGYDLIYGFPNKKSAPGFKKRLGWVIDDTCHVVGLTEEGLLSLKIVDSEHYIKFDFSNKELCEWRLSKPGQCYKVEGKNITKLCQEGIDILYHENNFLNLEAAPYYKVLVEDGSEEYINQRTFPYVFGYRIFNKALKYEGFKKDLILSDVF